ELLSLNALVRKLAEQFTNLFGNKLASGDFRIDIQLAPQDALVMVDPTQLETAVLRLLKWIHARVRVGTLTVSTSQNGNQVRLSLIDDGPGLTPEEQADLFKPFQNIEADVADLGLALASGIIRQAQGTITILSEPHRNELAIDLPAASAEVTSLKTHMPANKQTVLVVDDEELVRNYLVLALEHLGYEAIPAQDGNEALFHCLQSKTNLDVLLTDMVLPGMNGRQIAEQAKKVRPTLKFIFMSGYTENLLAEGRVFLRKPVTPDQLDKALRHVLSTSSDTLTKALSSAEVHLE
ncbi:MAG TPA: response regulator, partial [Gemmatales bacterium]|nr:response regulator [Gemmatales bacterium]